MKYQIRKNTKRQSLEIRNNLLSFNHTQVPSLEKSLEDCSQHISDEKGNLRAGILAYTLGNWMEVDFLWVDEAYRKHGLGVQLLERIEQMASEKNCVYVKVDTFHFQALNFYKKQGYELFGTIENRVNEDLTHYFLVKYIA